MPLNRSQLNIAMALLLFIAVPLFLGVDAFTYSDPVVRSGNMYYKRKDYKRALKRFLEAGDDLKDNSVVYFNIASAYYKTNDFKNALKYYESALKRDDAIFNAKIIFNMGNCYFKEGKFQEAYEKYKASLKLNSADMNTKYNLEFVLSMMDKNKKKIPKRRDGKGKSSKRNSGTLDGNNNMSPPDNAKRSDETKSDDLRDGSSPDDFSPRNDLEDISKDDALRILSTLTEQVIVRTPMREENLAKRGEDNEKDW